MMYRVEPQVFPIGETRIIEEGLRAYLNYLGIPDWVSDAPPDSEKIVECITFQPPAPEYRGRR